MSPSTPTTVTTAVLSNLPDCEYCWGEAHDGWYTHQSHCPIRADLARQAHRDRRWFLRRPGTLNRTRHLTWAELEILGWYVDDQRREYAGLPDLDKSDYPRVVIGWERGALTRRFVGMVLTKYDEDHREMFDDVLSLHEQWLYVFDVFDSAAHLATFVHVAEPKGTEAVPK